MKAKEVLNLLRICRVTLYTYHKKGIIKAKRTVTGRLDYDDESVFTLYNKNEQRKNVLYCRVSTPKQKKDLENQEDTLKKFCGNNGIIINDIYKDIGSGINFERRGFQNMLDDIVNYKISKIFITYKDRLSRISFNMFKSLFNKFQTEIIILNEIDDEKMTEKEIFNEIINLIHCFSMKVYSSRRKQKLKLIEKDLKLETE
jgi:predicted site-specific integrase-resolvase